MKLNFGKNRTLTKMPQMRNTLNGWEVPINLVKITQNISEGVSTLTEENISFMGVWQPLRAEQLQSKPEGQRSWTWYWIHAKTGELNLDTADKIIFNGKRYKVMNKKDYDLNGFVEYEVILDYENS